MKTEVFIQKTGMISSIGMNKRQTYTSIRAGLNRFQEMPSLYYCQPADPDFETPQPLVAAPLGYLDAYRNKYHEPAEWCAYLAAQAFFDMLQSLKKHSLNVESTSLFFALPDYKKLRETEQDFLYHFHNFVEQDYFSHIQCNYNGHTVVLQCLEEARSLIRQGTTQRAVIGGVESYLFPERLQSLDEKYRVKSERNHSGFIPGEGAAFLMVTGERSRADEEQYHFVVSGLSNLGKNAKQADGAIGEHLSTVLNEVLNNGMENPLILCDLNGESHRMKEWGITLSRLGTKLGEPLLLFHPAVSLGDIGAASGAMLLSCAVQLLQEQYKNRNSAVIWTAGDDGSRSAVLLRRYDDF